jgi:hypothetical protein
VRLAELCEAIWHFGLSQSLPKALPYSTEQPGFTGGITVVLRVSVLYNVRKYLAFGKNAVLFRLTALKYRVKCQIQNPPAN